MIISTAARDAASVLDAFMFKFLSKFLFKKNIFSRMIFLPTKPSMKSQSTLVPEDSHLQQTKTLSCRVRSRDFIKAINSIYMHRSSLVPCLHTPPFFRWKKKHRKRHNSCWCLSSTFKEFNDRESSHKQKQTQIFFPKKSVGKYRRKRRRRV